MDNERLTKQCSDCGQVLSINMFYSSTDRKKGYSFTYARCKKCTAQRRMDIATGKIVPSQGKHVDKQKMMKNVQLNDFVTLANSMHMSYGEYMEYLYRKEGRYC